MKDKKDMWMIIVLGMLLLDQVTKYLVVASIGSNYEIEVISDLFYLANVQNRGAAWGILQDGRVLFISITLVVVCGILYFMKNMRKRYVRFALAVVLGGTLGNFLDRVFRGYVVDFLDFYIGGYHFPTFNVADVCITVGVIVLMYFVLIDKDFRKISQEEV